MAGPVSLTVDPYAGGQIRMDQAMFAAAKEVLKKAPNDPGNMAMHQDLYLAAMIVDLRIRAVNASAVGQPAPRNFTCPICHAPVHENIRNQSYECSPCGRGFTTSYIATRFFDPSPQYLQNTPAKAWNSQSSTSAISGSGYARSSGPINPKLTAAVPAGVEVDLSKVKVDEVVKDEPIKQWRAWRVNVTEDDWLLRSVTYGKEVWKGMEPMEATHVVQSGPNTTAEHESPSWHCHCGIYGVKTLVQAQKWGESNRSQVQVLGKTSYWGKIHHYETGIRAQFAYPWELWIPDDDVLHARLEKDNVNAKDIKRALEKAYGVEVHIDSGMFNLGLSHT